VHRDNCFLDDADSAVLSGRMALYDGLHASFRTIKLRPRQRGCVVCGVSPLVMCPQDYESWCRSCALPVVVLPQEDRVTCSEYKAAMEEGQTHLLVDVREEREFHICHLKNAISILKYNSQCVSFSALLIGLTFLICYPKIFP